MFVPATSPGGHRPDPVRPPASGSGHRRFIVVSLLLAAAAMLLAGCGQPAPSSAPASTVVGTVTVGPLPTTAPSTVTVVEVPATASAVAVRVSPPSSVEVAPPVPTIDPEFAALPCAERAGLALEVGWPRTEVPKVLRTMWRESRCLPWVRSTTSDSGLMQINDVVLRDWRFQRDFPVFFPQSLFDPTTNLTVALWLWHIDGWTPWRGGA